MSSLTKRGINALEKLAVAVERYLGAPGNAPVDEMSARLNRLVQAHNALQTAKLEEAMGEPDADPRDARITELEAALEVAAQDMRFCAAMAAARATFAPRDVQGHLRSAADHATKALKGESDDE